VPRGPQGQHRPADTVANEIGVAKIATGEVAEDMVDTGKDKAAQFFGPLAEADHLAALDMMRRARDCPLFWDRKA
jgi:hypothetical protein